MSAPVRICFVCLGNICRSPTAEAVMAHRLAEAGLDGLVVVESAGTGNWHIGEPADARARAEAGRRGIPMSGRAQQFTRADFARFDLVLAMDAENVAALQRIAPAGAEERVRLFRSFDPDAAHHEVPDPYFGGEDGFTAVFDMVDAACRGLIDHLRAGPLRDR